MSYLKLRVVEDIMRDDNVDVIHVIVPGRNWRHFDSVECPSPIRAWLGSNYPEVKIERIAGFQNNYAVRSDDDCDELGCTSELQNFFYVAFINPEQVESFAHAFSTPPLDTLDEPADFILATVRLDARENVALEELA